MRTARRRTFVSRIGFCITCAIPADLLSDEPDEPGGASLHSEASRDNISFMQAIRELAQGLYLARVAADPERVAQGYTVLFREEQLYDALPWDQRLKGKSSEQILAHIRVHAAEVRPLTLVAIQQKRADIQTVMAPLTPIDTVEVTEEEMKQVITLVTKQRKALHENQRGALFHFQQGLLCTMIDSLMGRLYQGQDQVYARTLYKRCALLAQLQRWHRQNRECLVNAVAHFSSEQQQVVWRLTAGFPVQAARAA